ncbi:Gfo/Idh/MocA family protein [Aequorivita lipolytica]|uniref:Gfo/Idh/MocA family oxidoreductase n=1 Tax=Aequorivita lipolytica TaxID=153267 RepID=A0A5C6YLN2_9FLAO|nr:Gfo/Idh/MocA family oxidoreductase [Aequorivita lipolytica]TXD67992.1 Gfo/Idh/MocA family oxidoreductase [Aequorivita lipolytica]SRX52201.1 scyllo-inositol 2-dehydrogenase (NAD(+)) [Aequorivita lipolytica]
MLKAGVLGAGHLGKIHLKLLQQSTKYELVGFFDASKEASEKIESEFGYKSFPSMESLIDASEMVVVVTPTSKHFECAEKVINAGKHLFIEKPITQTVAEAEQIRDLAKLKKVRGQVGQVERFNPAFMAIKDKIDNPMFIETHRLAEFNPRGTDVSVVLDLMIHDIDAILSVVKSPVKAVSASGVSVISETPDIANARIEFENGCVANLTASRISLKKMRKARFFQRDAYISVDFLEKKCEVVKMKNAPTEIDDFAMVLTNAEGIKKQIYFENPKIENNNAILDELESFYEAIKADRTPEVSLQQGTEALRVAMMIIENFKKI